MQRDSLLPEWANGINYRKSKKQSTGKRRIQTVQQKDKNNPHQFDWEEALEKPNAVREIDVLILCLCICFNYEFRIFFSLMHSISM